MISGSLLKNSLKVDIEAAAWLIERLAAESGRNFDRLHIRRAVEEAAAVWSGEMGNSWWKWIVDASQSLGMKCKVIDSTFDQLRDMLADNARILLRQEQNGLWLAISGYKRGRYLVLQPLSDHPRRWESRKHLKQSLNIDSSDNIVRFVVFEPQMSGTLAESGYGDEKTPFRRFVALLQPDRGDIGVITVFALITGLLALATPLAVETLVNTVAFGQILQPVIVISLMLLAFLSFSAALRVLQSVVVEIIQRRLFARVAADLSYRLPRVDIEALDGRSSRELVNRFFDIITVQKVAAQLLLDGISLILATIIGMVVLAFYHPWLLGFDLILLVLIAMVIFVLGHGAIGTSIKESKSKYLMAAWLENLASCPIAFRQAGAPEFALERSDRIIHQYLTYRRNHFSILMRQIVFALGLNAVASTVLLGLGGWLVMTGQLTLGQLVAAELIVSVIVGSFAKLGKHMESFYDVMASVDKLGVLLDLPMEEQNGLLAFPTGKAAHIKLTNLSYHGPSGKQAVHDLNFEIDSGEKIIVTGKSGSGKSELMDLLFALRTPDAGYLTINNNDPREFRPDALRRHVSLVRSIEIFDGTIAENVHLERPNVTTQDVRDALGKLGLLEEILELPDGLETQLVETGFPLSLSQQRKLMVARGICSQPTLLLVDGIIDGLPVEDIREVGEAIFDPMAPWTLILVTVRTTLMSRASRFLNLGDRPTQTNEGIENG